MVPGQKSGILVYGEQRGAALGDFDGDGRVDLVVSQNGAETKLYQNVLGNPACGCDWRAHRAIPTAWGRPCGWDLGRGRGRRGRFMAVRATGQRTARCRCWAARKPRRKSGFAGPAAKPRPVPSRRAQRNYRGLRWQADNESLVRLQTNPMKLSLLCIFTFLALALEVSRA